MFVTSEEAQANGKSNIVFKQGIEAEDIQNASSYEGDAISVGVSLGNTDGKPQANMNGIGYGADSDSNSSITKGGVSGYNDEDRLFTTENRDALAGKLENSFDAGRVNEELGAQTQITQEFGKEAPKAVAKFAEKKMEAYETAQKAVNMLREDLEATKDPEKIVYISDQLQLAEQQLNESETDYQNWKEGGKYRVATHALLLGGLGTGSVEGVLTTGGTTTITGKPNGTKNGIGAAETGGAILAISDAKEGAYTYNPDGSVTGSGNGRATNTGKRDGNGNEIYQRDSGGYYYIDDKGVQRTTVSPNERPAANTTGYNRPYLRQQTIQDIEANYTKLDNGDYYDPANDIMIKGPIDIGHAYGREHRRLELAAAELNMTQKELNDYVNSHPQHFRLENMSKNRGHADEMQGKDIPQELRDEMQGFLDSNRSKGK